MKRNKFFLIFVLAAVLLTGCGKKAQNDSGLTPETNENVQNNNEDKPEIVKGAALPDDIAQWSEVSRYTGDVDGDGTDENVVLATSAERGENGLIMWNDGQNWALYVDDRENSYVLLREYIQLGNVYFEVADYYTEQGAEPHINIISSTGSGFCVKSCKFSEADSAYEVTTAYDTSRITKAGINKRFSSIPEIDGEN